MGEQKNTIVLNGKVYDAKSGSPLNSVQQNRTKHKIKVMDSVIHKPAKHVKKPAPSHKITVKHEANETVHAVVHAHTTPEHAKTLICKTVKKTN